MQEVTSAEMTDRISFSTNLTLTGTEAKITQIEGIQNNYPLYGTTQITKIANTTT